MSHSRQIAVTAIGVVAAVAVLVTMLRAGRTRSRPMADTVANHTEVSRGEVATADTTTVRDPAALEQLETMGAYLRSLKAFQLKADVVTEDVRTDGQKV